MPDAEGRHNGRAAAAAAAFIPGLFVKGKQSAVGNKILDKMCTLSEPAKLLLVVDWVGKEWGEVGSSRKVSRIPFLSSPQLLT